MSAYLERLFGLQGKVAIVTGASRGIGAAIADALAGAGARVIGVGRSAVGEPPAGVTYRRCDVRDAAAFSALCDETVARHGRLDILVNAAGITVPDAPSADHQRVFDETLATNLSAAYRCCEAVAPHMRRGGGGAIINITSVGSVLGFPGNPGYVAAKGGLRLLTKALARDWAQDNIRVNNIAPGYVRTAMTEASYADPVRHAERLGRMMMPRWGTPEDIAGAAIFLASEAAGYITGADLFVDGGWTAKGL